jgi:hypothetical protein
MAKSSRTKSLSFIMFMMVPQVHRLATSIMRRKPVKPVASGFEAQTTKIVHALVLMTKPTNVIAHSV